MLETGSVDRPAARFNRQGEDALYLSPDAESARVAIGGSVRAGDAPRFLLEYDVSECIVLDLRHASATDLYVIAAEPWLPALARGEEPASWRVSDFLRANHVAGLIDPSRRRPGVGMWALTLFRWNVQGAPVVRLTSPPSPIAVPIDHR